jgi:uncharacterized protein
LLTRAVPMSDDLYIQAGPVLATKFADDEISGHLCRYGETDADGETFAPGAFMDSLAEIKATGHRVPLLWQHRQGEPIGSWHEIVETADGLFGKARINTDVPRGREALSLVTRGDLSGLSVGFVAPPEWRRGRTILRAKLYECSLVSIPAVPKARVRLKDFSTLPALAAALTAGQPLARKDAEWLARKAFAAGASPELNPEQLDALAERIERATQALKGL